MPTPTPIHVTPDQRRELERLHGAAACDARTALRAGIILKLSLGLAAETVAREMRTSMTTVSKWRGRWSQAGLAGLADSVGRRGNRPVHFPLWLDQDFAEKFWDVAGLYINPPQCAIALFRDSEDPPPCEGPNRLPADRTVRSSQLDAVSLCAALAYLSAKVFARTAPSQKPSEWLDFLRKVEAEMPGTRRIHILCDNFAIRQCPPARRWLARHPRFQTHISPTAASWLILVERFFEKIIGRTNPSDNFANLSRLIPDIYRFLNQHKAGAYQWTAQPGPASHDPAGL